MLIKTLYFLTGHREHNNVMNANKKMNDDLKERQVVEHLKFYRTCGNRSVKKEEKKSLDKWRYKEIWLLDYVRGYGNNATKVKGSKQNRETAHKRDERWEQRTIKL